MAVCKNHEIPWHVLRPYLRKGARVSLSIYFSIDFSDGLLEVLSESCRRYIGMKLTWSMRYLTLLLEACVRLVRNVIKYVFLEIHVARSLASSTNNQSIYSI